MQSTVAGASIGPESGEGSEGGGGWKSGESGGPIMCLIEGV